LSKGIIGGDVAPKKENDEEKGGETGGESDHPVGSPKSKKRKSMVSPSASPTK
jgi:hypothetical protein